MDAAHENLARVQVRETAALQAAQQRSDADKSRQKHIKALQTQQNKARSFHVQLACMCVSQTTEEFLKLMHVPACLKRIQQHRCFPVAAEAVPLAARYAACFSKVKAIVLNTSVRGSSANA